MGLLYLGRFWPASFSGQARWVGGRRPKIAHFFQICFQVGLWGSSRPAVTVSRGDDDMGGGACGWIFVVKGGKACSFGVRRGRLRYLSTSPAEVPWGIL